MKVWKVWVNLNALENQDMYVWTILQTIESGWDSHFFVGYSLFEFYAKCGSKQTWQIDYPLSLDQKRIFGWRNTTLLWLFSTLLLKVSYLVLLCVHERECIWKKYELNFDVSLKPFFNILVGVFLKFLHCFFKLLPFHIIHFQCSNFFWVLKVCCFELWFGF